MTEPVTHEYGPYRIDENGRTIWLAKFIARAGENDTVVFLNGDPLDCRRENLKVIPGPKVNRPIRGRRRR